jgi:hypothetical protein
MKRETGFNRRQRFSALAAALVVPAVLGFSSPAEACGGFWCSQSSPVDQTGEQIIFSKNTDGTVTCVVQIAYTGPSERFAWLLPVAGIPKISVSSSMAIQRLSQATAPQYRLERHLEGTCKQYDYRSSGGAASFFPPPSAGAADAAATPPVQVLDQGSVGPYDYVTISVDPALTAPADAAIKWLTDQGYDVFGVTADVLGPYLADGMNLIAFRLTKGVETGSIRPVVITFPGDRPTIPIRPTAVAAQNDMGVLVWVLAEHQAVPENYRSLVLNEALINWFNSGANYDQVVTAAANEAEGQGFVTELAQATTPFNDTVFTSNDAQGLSQLENQTFTDPIDLIFAASSYYRGWDGWRESIAAAVTLPPGVTLDDFGRNPEAYRGASGVTVDASVFLEHLRTDVVEPMQKTQELINSLPYVTRLYSTMSPDEMTLDPVFTFNPDLAPVSNVHTADLYVECRPDLYEGQAPWRIVLPRGGTLRGVSQTGAWPISLSGGAPANLKIVQLSETGSGQVITDNTDKVAAMFASMGGVNTPPTTQQPQPGSDAGVPIGGYDKPPPPRAPVDGTCACSLHGTRAGETSWLVAGVVLATLVRRRRGR